MRRRPQPNRRRGLLRAVGAAIVLIAVVIGASLLVSTLTAPAVKAPTVPTTPTPLVTPRVTPLVTPPAATPKPSKTAGKKKDIAMGSRISFSSRTGAAAFLRLRTHFPDNAVASPNGSRVAYFQDSGDAYAHNPLYVQDRRSGRARVVGFGDPLVRPVWSAHGDSLLYVRVARTRRFPGAAWALVRTDLGGHSEVLARRTADTMMPLGWSGNQVLYAVGEATDTGVRAIAGGHDRFLTILATQIVTHAALAGRYIAFTTPTNCGYCTIDVFNLDATKQALRYGPSGLPSEGDLAWAADGSAVVALSRNRLAVIDPSTAATHFVPAPANLPRLWVHPLVASVHGTRVALTDTITRATYRTGG